MTDHDNELGKGKASTSGQTGSSTSGSTVQHVAVKMPTFMEDSVDAWFSIAEAQFETSNVRTTNTKFFTTLANLPPNVVKLIPRSILQSKNYEQLKDAVINVYERSKPELLDRLLKNSNITGRPSLFLQEMMSSNCHIL